MYVNDLLPISMRVGPATKRNLKGHSVANTSLIIYFENL